MSYDVESTKIHTQIMDLLNSFLIYAYVSAVVLHNLKKDNDLVTPEVKAAFMHRICQTTCVAFAVPGEVELGGLRARIEILAEMKF